MRHFIYITLLLVSVFYTSIASENQNSELQCEVLQDGNKKIQCTYMTDRLSYDRTIVFIWHSQNTPHDDRERTLVIKANNSSVYDYRYYYGRAQGIWEISVKDDRDNLLALTTFIIE